MIAWRTLNLDKLLGSTSHCGRLLHSQFKLVDQTKCLDSVGGNSGFDGGKSEDKFCSLTEPIDLFGRRIGVGGGGVGRYSSIKSVTMFWGGGEVEERGEK